MRQKDQWLDSSGKGLAYHLKLTAEQLASTIIIVGDPERVAEVAKRFDRIDHHVRNREFHTITGQINNAPISVISSGIGVDNIDILINEIEYIVNGNSGFRKKLTFIRLGTTGATQKDIQVGEKIISKYAIGIEGLMHHYDLAYAKDERLLATDFAKCMFLPVGNALPYAVGCDPKLDLKFPKSWRRGITLTANGFYAPQFRVPANGAQPKGKGIMDLSTFSHQGLVLSNIEMECSGLYGLAKLFHHEALTICTVLANRVTGEICKSVPPVVDALLDESIEVISDRLLKKS